MKKISFILILIILSFNLSAQIQSDSAFVATIPAKFMDDDTGDKFSKFVVSVLKYPETSKRLDGRVYAQFVIDTVGNVTEIKIIKSLRADYDQALIDAIKQSPKWTPATLENRPVPYKMVYPIFFYKKARK